jgi:hypothetical protein
MAGMDYARGTPPGSNGIPLYGSPAPVKALVSRLSENAVASSVITMGENTTAIEVAAAAIPALLRWVPTTDTQASVTTVNYDHVVPAATVRRFVVPIEAMPTSSSSVQGVNRLNGLFQRYAIKTQAIGSVYSSEYGSSNSY